MFRKWSDELPGEHAGRIVHSDPTTEEHPMTETTEQTIREVLAQQLHKAFVQWVTTRRRCPRGISTIWREEEDGSYCFEAQWQLMEEWYAFDEKRLDRRIPHRRVTVRVQPDHLRFLAVATFRTRTRLTEYKVEYEHPAFELKVQKVVAMALKLKDPEFPTDWMLAD
jgi:hypothetical protein